MQTEGFEPGTTQDRSAEPFEISVLSIPDGLPRWHLVADFLRLRKEVFIDRLAWPLHARDGFEFEQYDTVHAVYIVAHRGDAALGGARLLPTTHRVGEGRYVYSYMIRDACRGILPGLPADLCDAPPPVARDTWELTRLATLGDLKVATAILQAVNAHLKSQGARQCLFLAPPALLRMAARLKFAPRALGALKANADGSFLVFGCDVV